MNVPVELVLLKCVRCSTPVPANPREWAWVCEECGQGLLLDAEKGPVALEVHTSSATPAGQPGLPFWVAQGMVVLERKTYNTFGKKDREAQKFWSAPRTFYVPAFDCALDTVLDLGVELLRKPFPLESGPPASFSPVTLSPGDMPTLAEFLVLEIEAERRDNVKSIHFKLKLDPPALWILPK